MLVTGLEIVQVAIHQTVDRYCFIGHIPDTNQHYSLV
jgi:hypothetical protein